MKNNQRIQIIEVNLDGSMKGYGYDGEWFNTFDDALSNMSLDFTEAHEGVVELRFVWGNADSIKQVPAMHGEELIEAVSEWLIEIGVLHGN